MAHRPDHIDEDEDTGEADFEDDFRFLAFEGASIDVVLEFVVFLMMRSGEGGHSGCRGHLQEFTAVL